MHHPKKSVDEINPPEAHKPTRTQALRLASSSGAGGDGSKASPRVQFPGHLKPSSSESPAGTPASGSGSAEGGRPSLPYQDSDLTEPGYASSIGTDEGEDSEEYDWSAEEDLVDEAAKFESKMGMSKREGWSFKSVVTIILTSLIGSVFLAGLIVTPALIVHFYWYNPNPTPTRLYIKDNVEAWLFWAAANLIISWFLAMVIDIIPILVRFFLSISWGHVSEYVKTRIETYDSVKNTAKPAFYAASGYASWVIIFSGIYELYDSSDPKSSRAAYTQQIENVVQFFFFLVLVWCIQGMLAHFVAFSFHRTAYRERIETVEKALTVIERLRQYRPKPSATNKSSGVRTPALGHGVGPTFSEKQHYKALSGALLQVAPPVSRGNSAATTAGSTIACEERDGDVEDLQVHDRERTLVGSTTRSRMKKTPSTSRLSWFDRTKKDDTNNAPDYIKGLDGEIERNKGRKVETFVGDAMQESSDNAGSGNLQHAKQVSEPNLNHSEGRERAQRQHRYPPTPRAGTSSQPDIPLLEGGSHIRKSSSVPLKAARVLKHAVLHDARNLSGTAGDLGGLAWNVNSAHAAKRLARSIYTRFKAPGRTWLIPSDFYAAYHDEGDANEAFKVFDKDNNEDISRAEIKTTLLKIYKERRLLSRSMRDVSQALKTLDRVLLFFAAVVVFFISLSVFGVQLGTSLTSIYSLGLAASFIFKNSASSAFDAIMFLFVTHPYDTGDRVFVDQENLVVKKVGLFATVFQRYDGTETYYFNSQLFNKFIINVRRSGNTWENLTMQVSWTTPLTKLDALEKCINDWLSTEENRWFEPSTNITLQHIKNQRYLELTIGIGYNGNWQDWGLRQTRKTAFHAAVQYYCRELGIIGWEPPIPIVFADPKTMTYQPSVGDFNDDVLSPTLDPSQVVGSPTDQRSKDEVMEEVKDMKPTLGFLPPLAVRSSRLIRVRKSRDKKANLGAGNAA